VAPHYIIRLVEDVFLVDHFPPAAHARCNSSRLKAACATIVTVRDSASARSRSIVAPPCFNEKQKFRRPAADSRTPAATAGHNLALRNGVDPPGFMYPRN
jgi:hypothetical protein